MPPELIADGLLITLLAATIAVVWRLERRLSAIREGQAAMTALAGTLAEATQRAEIAIRSLRATADAGGTDLDVRIKRARALADELAMLTDRCGEAPTLAPARPQILAGAR